MCMSLSRGIHQRAAPRINGMDAKQPDPEDSWGEQAPRALDERRTDSVALVEGECGWCGLVTMAIHDLGCIASDDGKQGLCQFVCPVCDRLAIRGVTLLEVKTLLVAGAVPLDRAPLELLEAKQGDAISWDDVLDFSIAFQAQSLSK